MVKMEVACYYKDTKDKIIGAEVTVHSEAGDVIDRILVTDNHGLEELREKLDNLDDTYVDKNELIEVLEHNVFGSDNIKVNATTFDGHDSSYYSIATHNHENQFAPLNHQDNTNKYGSATSSKYGHVKVRNNLTQNNPNTIDEALNSYQGYLIDQRLDNVESDLATVSDAYYRNSMMVKIGRWSDGKGEDSAKIQVNANSGNGIYVKLYCDKSDYSLAGREVIMVVNGVPYSRTTDANGKSSKLNINLGKGVYLISAFRGSYDGFNTAFVQKILEVI